MFVLLWGIIYKLNNLEGEKLSIWYDENGNELKVPIIKTLKGKDLTLTTYFKKTDNEYIVFPEIDGNYDEIYLNNVLIKKIEYGKNHLFNLYLKPHLVFLGNNLKEVNELKIIIFDLYKGGIKTVAILINNEEVNKYSILKFFNYGITSSIGGIIFLSLLLLIDYLFFLKTPSKKIFLYYFFSLILLLIATRDFHYVSWGNPKVFLMMKKTFFISLYSSFMFFLQTFYLNYKKKNIISFFSVILLTIPIMFFIFSKDLYTLMEYYNKFAIIPLSVIILMMVLYKEKDQDIILFSFLLFTIIHDVIATYYPVNGDRFLFQYTIFSFTIFIGLKLIEELKTAHIMLNDYSQKAYLDPLTRSYNRFLLTHIELTFNDTLVFLDLNDMKIINDTYGHEKGDEALIYLSKTIKKHIRNEDFLIRYGGDEFIVILKNCGVDIAKSKFLEIQKDLNNFEIPLSISFGIAKVNKDLYNTLKLADKRMYKMKRILKSANTNKKREA
jgi:diguanylate cyclase (GGDEF)-like protein